MSLPLVALVAFACVAAGYRLGMWNEREEQKERARLWTTEG